eukprot:scaffold32467_cov53-Phaeocystis_antarctica.AAC.3
MPGAQRSPDDDDDADDDADDAVEEISTDDGRDLGDVSEVAGQLAGATSQIAEQLSMITEAAQPGQSAVWARAAARLLCLLHLSAVGSSALPGSGRPTGHPAPHDHGGAMSDTSPMRPASRRGPSG